MGNIYKYTTSFSHSHKQTVAVSYTVFMVSADPLAATSSSLCIIQPLFLDLLFDQTGLPSAKQTLWSHVIDDHHVFTLTSNQ